MQKFNYQKKHCIQNYVDAALNFRYGSHTIYSLQWLSQILQIVIKIEENLRKLHTFMFHVLFQTLPLFCIVLLCLML
jgi:hypothetical protein